MSDMPAKIWANSWFNYAEHQSGPFPTPYTRSDLADKLAEALEDTAKWLTNYANGADKSIELHPEKRDYYHGKRKGLFVAADAIRAALAAYREGEG